MSWGVSQRRARKLTEECRQLFIDVLSVLLSNQRLTENEMDELCRSHELIIERIYEVIYDKKA